jgi:hypothetical protein
MYIRDISLGVMTGLIVTLAWWLSHFPAPTMAMAILPSMSATTCLWLSMPTLKTWRVLASHALAAMIAASSWFFLHDLTVSLCLSVSAVAILTTSWLRHAPAVATAAACAMHPDKLPQLAMAITIQLAVIALGVQLFLRVGKRA